MFGGSAVAAEEQIVEAGGFHQALKAAACMSPCVVRAGTDGAGGRLGASQLVVAKLEAGFALGGGVEADVGCAPEAPSEEEKAFECFGGLGAACDG